MKSSRSVSHGAPKLPTTLYPDMSAPHYEHYVDDAVRSFFLALIRVSSVTTTTQLPLGLYHTI